MVWKKVDPYPEVKRSWHSSVNSLAIANVAASKIIKEIYDNEEGNFRKINDTLSNSENTGINVLDCQKEDILPNQKTGKLRKGTITYDKMNNQFSVGFP